MNSSLLLAILLLQGVAPAKGGIVSGTLRGPGGAAAARQRVGVMAIPEPGRGVRGAGTLISQGQTDDAGKFQLEDVPSGRYYIVAGRLDLPTFYPGVREMGAAKTIEVRAAATVRNIDFEMIPETAPRDMGFSVTGRIVLKNNPTAPMPSFIMLHGLQQPVQSSAPAAQAMIRTTSVTADVARDGSFKVIVPGVDQRFSDVVLPDGYSLVSITAGGRNVLKESIDPKRGVELLVSVDVGDLRPRYRLMALVREENTDRLLAGERVELVQPSGEVLRLMVNAQGVVTFPRVFPGTYVVRLASEGFDVPEKHVVITDSSVQVELRARKKP